MDNVLWYGSVDTGHENRIGLLCRQIAPSRSVSSAGRFRALVNGGWKSFGRFLVCSAWGVSKEGGKRDGERSSAITLALSYFAHVLLLCHGDNRHSRLLSYPQDSASWRILQSAPARYQVIMSSRSEEPRITGKAKETKVFRDILFSSRI